MRAQAAFFMQSFAVKFSRKLKKTQQSAISMG